MGEMTRFQQVRGFLANPNVLQQFQMALRATDTKPEQVARIALTTLANDPTGKLLRCSNESILSAIVTACQLGLEPDNTSGLGYLVPYGSHCTFIPGYRGLIRLMYNDGSVSVVTCQLIRQNDEFDYDAGRNYLSHKFSLMKPRGDVIGAYCRVQMVSGAVHFTVMSRAEIDEVRDRYSQAYGYANKGKQDSPWHTDYESMALKTVARRAAKWVPSSPTLQRAVTIDEQSDRGAPLDIVDVDTVAPSIEASNPVEALAAEAEAKAPGPENEPPTVPEAPKTPPEPAGAVKNAGPEQQDPSDATLTKTQRDALKRKFAQLPAEKQKKLAEQFGIERMAPNFSDWTVRDRDNLIACMQD